MNLLILAMIVFCLGFIIGYGIFHLRNKSREYVGTIKAIQEEDRLLYSLEIDGDPIELMNKDEVIFKVDTSDKSSNRKQNS